MKKETAEFQLPIKLVSMANARMHHFAKARIARDQRGMAKVFCPQFDVPCIVTITRIGPKKLDDDNLAISAKHVRDGIAAKIGVDDGDERYTWRYEQRKGKPKQYAVHVKLERAA